MSVRDLHPYWCVSDWLIDCGLEVVPIHPKQVKAIANAKLKNDKIDAQVLCHLLRSNLAPEAYLPPQEQRELKVLVRSRKQLVETRSKLKNQIRALLWKEGIKSLRGDVELKNVREKSEALLENEIYRYCLKTVLPIT